MKVFDVFTPTATPTITLIEDHLIDRKAQFRDALEQGGALINISGPSKSGKTVFIKNIVGGANLVPVSGAGVSTADELWLRVFHVIGTPVEQSNSEEQGSTVTIGGSATIGAAFFAKAEGQLSGSANLANKQSGSTKKAVDFLQLLIAELAKTGLVLFIDDFHYIPRDAQEIIARQIKEAIDKGVLIVCASVPNHTEDVLKANADLRGRIVTIDFDFWPPDALRKIPERGFKALNVTLEIATVEALISEVAGSPQLMQSLCLNTCLEAGVRVSGAAITLPSDTDFYGNVCYRTASTADYSSTLEKLVDGPKTRGTERKQYRLRDGSVGDVYTILIQALALDPPSLHFRYPDLQERISRICEADTPVGSSVTGAGLHIAQLANDGTDRTIMAWDQAEDVLDIRDPYLLFYLRWHEPR